MKSVEGLRGVDTPGTFIWGLTIHSACAQLVNTQNTAKRSLRLPIQLPRVKDLHNFVIAIVYAMLLQGSVSFIK